MIPIDWLLLVLNPLEDAPGPLDPIRIQKALFYVSRSPLLPADEKYGFEPYNYGPYSKQIYRDLDALVERQFVATVPAAGATWSRYGLTDAGARCVKELLPELATDRAEIAASARRLVTGLSFNALLRKVYSEYPEFAVNSIANV